MKQLWKDKHNLTYAGPGPRDGAQAYDWAMRELRCNLEMGKRTFGDKRFNDIMEANLNRLDAIKKIVAKENEALQSDLHLMQRELTHVD